MKIIDNKHIHFIDGYLAGLSDIDGIDKREFVNRAFFVKSDEIDLEESIKLFFDYMEEVEVLQRIKLPPISDVEYILEKLLLVNPFGIFNNNVKDLKDVLDGYSKYVVFHLLDYVDFSFEYEGVDFLAKEESYLALMKNKKQIFIVLVIRKKDVSLFFVFFRKDLNKEEYIKWFDKLVKYYEEKQEKL